MRWQAESLRRVFGGSLLAQLLWLSLFLVVVPGSVFAWIAIESAQRALEHAVGRQLAEVAHDTAERVEGEIDRIAGLVHSWALDPLLASVAPSAEERSRMASRLRALVGTDASIADLAVIDASGRVVASSRARISAADASTDAWWPPVLRGEQVIALLDPGRHAEGTGSVSVLSPLLDRDETTRVVGALRADLPWAQLDRPLQHLQYDLATLGLDVSVLVVDPGGRVVAGGWWEKRSPLAGENLRALGWRVADAGEALGPAHYRREPRAEALVGRAAITVGPLEMTALAVQPIAEALAPVRALGKQLVLALGAVLVVGLALAGLIASRLSRPLRELEAATREIAQVDRPPAPIPVRSRDEIGQLAASFNRMTADLTRARRDLVTAAKLAFVGELAAGMAHEIRTPLGIVRSSAQILGRSLAPSDTKSAELVGMIVSEVDRLNRVVAGLLELSRPHEPRLETASLAPVLARALDFVATQARERGIALQRDLSAGGRPVRCDPEQIYQVALNLLMNALQNAPRGAAVRLRTVATEDRVGFEVADDGPGIPPELHDSIFVPFFTLRPGGTGLGLALVQRLVQSHRGSVTVESEPGHGATFRVLLPAAVPEPGAEGRTA